MQASTPISSRVRDIYQQQFGDPALIVRSPGRINLIGEHTDYNLGFVLPAAIDKAIYIAISKREDDKILLYAADLDQSYTGSVTALHKSGQQWPDFILGVVQQLLKAGHPLNGFSAVVMGDVPLGAGLSSSAAVECATVFALNELFGLQLPRLTMVQTAQKAENEFVGLQCGIMDPFASMFGKEGHVIRLDCRSLDFAYMPFATDAYRIVLFDTGVKHSLASSEYNLRREECETGVRIIQKTYPQVNSLRDAAPYMVNECLQGGDQNVYHRCRFVVAEINRLQEACDDLVNNDLVAFGQKMFATHEGLSQLYEVSCPEADTLVDLVRHRPEVLGARMMGGGFGGCTINIVQKDAIDVLVKEVQEQYAAKFDRTPGYYVVTIANGTSLVTI
jgi:galactokinase